jgi:hypothetical protein
MATIDASLDELTGATIIITATIISTTDRSREWDVVVDQREKRGASAAGVVRLDPACRVPQRGTLEPVL